MRIRIIDHNGQTRVTEMETFDAAQTYLDLKAAQSSSSGDHMVLIGDKIIDARSVRSVEEDTDPTPVEWRETIDAMQKELDQTKLDLENATIELTMAMSANV